MSKARLRRTFGMCNTRQQCLTSTLLDWVRTLLFFHLEERQLIAPPLSLSLLPTAITLLRAAGEKKIGISHW